MTVSSPESGRFITFEGGEGAGKSTQIALLRRELQNSGVPALATREPGGTPRAERLRAALLSGRLAGLGSLAEAALFSAARIDHVDGLIRPALARGEWVLCDRFVDSTRAYQGAKGGVDDGVDARRLDLLEKAATAGLVPDLTVILDIAPEAGLARVAQRRGASATPDRFEGEDMAFHHALRRNFLDIAAANRTRCRVLDAARPAEAIARDIRDIVHARFLDHAGRVAAQ
jgi:dTMP kinase